MSRATLAADVRRRILKFREEQQIQGVYDFKESYLRTIENGERPLPQKGLIARALLEALPDLSAEHQLRIAVCGGWGLVEAPEFGQSPEPSLSEVFTFLQTMQKELGADGEALAARGVLVPWAYTRCHQMHCNMKAAISYAAIAGQYVMQIEQERPTGAVALVLLDIASAYHVFGHFGKSREFAGPARSVAFDIYRQGRGDDDRRVTKIVARSLLMEQTIAYYQDQERRVLHLQGQAEQYLRVSGDVEGSAKSLNTIALMRFHQQDWDNALKYAEPSAQDVAPQPSSAGHSRNDPVWETRDFSTFKRRWWYYPTQSLLFDIKTCKGQYCARPERPTLERDFPPFVPRYEWVATRKTDSADAIEGRLRSWERQAERDRFVAYLPDIHISHGDFLTVVKGDHERAQEQYEAAAAAAERYGLLLVKRTAERRIKGDGLPPGLALLA
jgi:hypothetical protein